MRSPEKVPRGIGLNYDGMRRCQRLPELRTPLIPRDVRDYIKARTDMDQHNCQQNGASARADRPMPGTP
jgi:hypothetical protein